MLRRLALEIESQTEECDCCGDSFGLRTVTLTLPGQFLCPRCESIMGCGHQGEGDRSTTPKAIVETQ